jgi:hypothetical protein
MVCFDLAIEFSEPIDDPVDQIWGGLMVLQVRGKRDPFECGKQLSEPKSSA